MWANKEEQEQFQTMTQEERQQFWAAKKEREQSRAKSIGSHIRKGVTPESQCAGVGQRLYWIALPGMRVEGRDPDENMWLIEALLEEAVLIGEAIATARMKAAA